MKDEIYILSVAQLRPVEFLLIVNNVDTYLQEETIGKFPSAPSVYEFM